MTELHPDAPKRTAVLPWILMEEIEHTHCWHPSGPPTRHQCCRCDKKETK